MHRRVTSPTSNGRRARNALLLAVAFVLGGCVTNGDFGRVRPMLVKDDIHDWVGRDAVKAVGGIPSEYPLTDDERLLRDYAFQLIEPPYDRNRWDSVWREWGLGQRPPFIPFDRAFYWGKIADRYRRSEASAYAQVNTDARNDVERIQPFFAVAERVADMDAKRAISLSHVGPITEPEAANAIRRNNENGAIIGWVCRSLNERASSYRFALGRLVITVPSPSAAEVDRSLQYLQTTINEYCRAKSKVAVYKD
jgi:hypothetical protein